jgi:hypothetical protein
LKLENSGVRRIHLIAALAFSIFSFQFSISAQPQQDPPHDITKVDPAPIGGAMNTPLPRSRERRYRKYEIPELVGAKQALGSQLIDGRLPKPRIDFVMDDGKLGQRISFFEGNLVVVRMTGAGGTIRKRVILPDNAAQVYLAAASVENLKAVRPEQLRRPNDKRRALLRIYDADGGYIERVWDSAASMPKELHRQVMPLQDLLRAISEDREVTNSIAGYDPKIGDELVGDDRKTWRVQRIIDRGEMSVVELRCIGLPQTMYVAKRDLHNYFIGARAN